MNAEPTFSVAVVGYGWAAAAHIDALNATGLARVTAVCSSRSPDPAELTARHGGKIQVWTSLDSMLAQSGVDAVSLCSYPSRRREEALAVARAGKHLIIEKPLALSLRDCQDILEAVEAAGIQACVCFECRYSNQFLVTRAVIDAGLLGEIHYGEVDYFHGIGPWYGQFRWNITREEGGSSLLSAGCHALDALLLCMNGEVESVFSAATASRSAEFAPYRYPTTSATILQFSDGRVGKVASVIDCLQPYYFHTHLVGSRGSLLDRRLHSEELALNKSSWSELSMKLLDSGDVSDHPYEAQFRAFFTALSENKPMPLTNLREAYRSFEVVFAADRSAEKRRPVTLEELRSP